MRPLLVLLAFATVAQAAPPSRCERGFDYWVGAWDVRPHGKPGPVSENRITSEQGSCVIQERWRSAPDGPGAGHTGTSFTIFDRSRPLHDLRLLGRGLKRSTAQRVSDGNMRATAYGRG